MTRFITLALVVASYLTVSAFKPKADTSAEVQFRPHMQAVYHSLTQVLHFILSDNPDSKSKDQATVENHLKTIAEHSSAIRQMATSSDKGHQFLAEELEKYSKSALAKFKAGQADQSRFFLSEMLQTCFACHTSRASEKDSDFAFNFSKNINLDDLDPIAKARFLSLSRQFDASAEAYERILLAEELSLDKFINFDLIVEYLVLTIRVKNQPDRTLKLLQSMKNKNYPEAVKADINSWVKVLSRVDQKSSKVGELERARELISSAKNAMEFPYDRSGMVQYIQASQLLREYLKGDKLSADRKAQAYYELGGCELMFGSVLYSGEAIIYFEEAIRLAPKTNLARKAYGRYEEQVLTSYSGSSGLHLPLDERNKLVELRKIAY